jgi:hypothetical protein
MSLKKRSLATTLLIGSHRLVRVGWVLCLLLVTLSSIAWANGGNNRGGAPEIDPGSTISALVLLTGGILLITDRILRKKS